MVNGFPQSERADVLHMLEKSMVILTAEKLDEHLSTVPYLSSSRDLANLYLTNICAETFGGSASRHVGLNEGTSFYLSHAYFTEQDRFADYVVHEAAHAVFGSSL